MESKYLRMLRGLCDGPGASRDWSVYVVRCSDDSLYTGVAKGVEARLKKHNAGRGAAYTRSRRPVRLLHREDGLTRSEALVREARIKRLPRESKEALVARGGLLTPAKKRKIMKPMLKTALLLLAAAAPLHAVPSFTKEDGVRITSAALQGADAAQVANAAVRFYYIRGSTAVYSAVTADAGTTFAEEAQVRLSTYTEPRVDVTSITGLSLQPLAGGGLRMLYSVLFSSPGVNMYRIYSATSADGLGWANEPSTRVETNNGLGFTGPPSVIKLATGDWRVFYTQNSDGTTAQANRKVYTSLSTDEGRSFSPRSLAVDARAGEAAAVKLTDNRVRLFYTAPLTGETTYSTILSALSTDLFATAFGVENGVRLSTTSSLAEVSNPFVIRSTDTWRWKLYYNINPFSAGVSTAAVHSASSYAPDPVRIAPRTILRTAGTTSFTVSGECFSGGASGGAAPTFQLKQGAATAPGAGGARTSDMSLTVDFTMTGQSLGYWDLVALNDNGFSATLANAVFVDFASGEVRLTDNLMRPRLGTRTKIDAITFNDGGLTIKLYTMAGELVQTIFDGYVPAGTNTSWWDGKTSGGAAVASGAYLLHTLGQKINSKEKIVVIK